MKRLLLCVSAGIVSALTLVQLFRHFICPELLFYKKAATIVSLYEQELRKSKQSCYILAGGSETKTTLIPSIMREEADINVINSATAAGNGVAANITIGLQHLRADDTLLLNLISVDGTNLPATASGEKFIASTFGLKAFDDVITPFQPSTVLTLLASDAASMLITPIRKLTRGYAFIYEKESTLHPDGWMEVLRGGMQHATLPKSFAQDLIISPACRTLLLNTQDACKKRHARLIVMFPIRFSNHYESKRRLMHALQITRMGIPVLKDERLGYSTNNRLFADMHLHMNAKGAEWNSRIIARLLKDESYWTEQEIINKMHEMGFTEDAIPQLPVTATAPISTP